MNRRTGALAASAALLLSACASPPDQADQDVCARQTADLADVRDAVATVDPAGDWAPGEFDRILAAAERSTTALLGYTPTDTGLTRAADTARERVEALAADLRDDATLAGNGHTLADAQSALDALTVTCGGAP